MKEKEDYKKGESLLERCDVIQKIGVYCYEVEISCHNMDGVISEKTEELIIIGNNKESIDESTEDSDSEEMGYLKSKEYTLKKSFVMISDEVMERFGLSKSKIDEILGGVNLELDNWDLRGKEYFSDCFISIQELREKRRVDSEPFDAEEIISKIASEYTLTPKRKKSLIKSIEKLV
jgi:hypothetical protein